MKLSEKRSRSMENSIVMLQRGRPLLLGNDIDEKVRKYIRYKGGQATFSIAIAVAKTLIEQCDNERLKALKFGKDWAQSLLRRMGFKERAVTTGKVIIHEGLIEKSRNDLHVTATFIIDLAGNILTMHLIYGGKTRKKLIKSWFPKGFFTQC